MENLIKAASEFLAAVLAALGFVGRPRRRAAIHQDLALLRDLEKSPDAFGPGTWSHAALVTRIELEVAKHAGISLARRKTPWASVVLAMIVGAPLGYLTIRLNESAFTWYSIFPGVIAGLMAVAILGMLFAPEEEAPTEAAEARQVGDETAPSDAGASDT